MDRLKDAQRLDEVFVVGVREQPVDLALRLPHPWERGRLRSLERGRRQRGSDRRQSGEYVVDVVCAEEDLSHDASSAWARRSCDRS